MRPLGLHVWLGPLLASLLTVNALAQVPPVVEETSDSHPPGWLKPDCKTQMEMDGDLVPIGKGAVFVPAMSDSAAEPPYAVLDQNSEMVVRRPTGTRAILSPGKYTIQIGSGVESQMMPIPIEVHEGHTTPVQPRWAGLLVRVVDDHGSQIRGVYELFALPSGEDFGIGLGADETRGETLRTWLLPPGRYMLVRSGESTHARSDFLTVRLLPGELVHFTLVQDEEGNFKGGGVVDRWEGRTEIENWRLGLRLGGDMLWNRNDHVIGRSFGNSVTINAFLDWSIRYLDPDHLVYGRIQVDEGQTAQPGQDMQKSIDEVDLDAIYTYRLLTWLGPYVRIGLNTNLFPGRRLFENPVQDVVILDSHNVPIRRLVQPDELTLADSFDPLELKEGIGVSFDLSPSLLLDLHLRFGFGARQTMIRSLLIERENDEPIGDCQDAMCFSEATSSNLLGAEVTLIGSARLTRWLMIDTELDSLLPFVASEGGTDPVMNWKNTVSLRLVSFASLAYVVKLDYNRQLSDFLQFEQRLLLRFTFDVL